MGPLLVGTAGLMWEHVAVVGPGPGGGLGALRLPPLGTVGRGRQPRRAAPAAWGDFGVGGGNRGLILSREVNDLIGPPEALAYFDRYFLRFCYANPAVFWSKGMDAPGPRFYSFTSRESIRAQLIEVPLWRRCPASSSLDWGKQPRLSNCEPAQTYLRELSAQFAVLCCGVLKGAAGGHDDVCFAFGRNLACR